MRKKLALIAVLAVFLLSAALLPLILRENVKFSGDRIRSTDPERFYLRFDRMNTEDAERMALQEGDVLRVSWQIESGSVDLLIAMAGETPLYRADGRGKGDTAHFDLTIPVTGDYDLSVSARNAKGWLEFLKVQ